jgi:hypothetical protein
MLTFHFISSQNFSLFPILQVQREVKFTLDTYVSGSKLYKERKRSSRPWQINATHADPVPNSVLEPEPEPQEP